MNGQWSAYASSRVTHANRANRHARKQVLHNRRAIRSNAVGSNSALVKRYRGNNKSASDAYMAGTASLRVGSPKYVVTDIRAVVITDAKY